MVLNDQVGRSWKKKKGRKKYHAPLEAFYSEPNRPQEVTSLGHTGLRAMVAISQQ